MQRGGPTFDEDSPLLGGAGARGAGVGCASLGKPTPSAFATAVVAAATPPREGIFRRE